MEERGGEQADLVAREVDVDEDVEGVPGEVGVGEARRLGPAGGSRGVEQDRGVVGVDVDRLPAVRGAGDQLVVGAADLQRQESGRS